MTGLQANTGGGIAPPFVLDLADLQRKVQDRRGGA